MSTITTTTGVLYSGPNQHHYTTQPLPPLTETDVKIRVHSAPINPSDQYFLAGLYPAGKQTPTMCGLEGAGLVVEAGSSVAAQALLGKRVAFMSGGNQGSWSSVVVSPAFLCVPLPDNITYEQGACAMVNPLTAEIMCEIAIEHNAGAVVMSAASSQLCLMAARLFNTRRIQVIALVRGSENVAKVTRAHEEYVNKGDNNNPNSSTSSSQKLTPPIILDVTTDDFDEKFQSVVKQYQPPVFFDAVGGAPGSHIIDMMPDRSTTYVYGILSGAPYTINIPQLIFNGKIIKGLWLSTELPKPGVFARVSEAMIRNLTSGIHIPQIAKRVPMEQYQEGVAAAQQCTREGKVLLVNTGFEEKKQ